MNKSILITGAHGFIGSNAALFFSKKGFNVIGAGHSRNTYDIKKNVFDEWIEGDITLKLLSKIKKEFYVIIHCAGSSSVSNSFINPKKDYEMTVKTTHAVLEYMKKYNPTAKLIYPSSAAVYGITNKKAIKETKPYNPISPYGRHKKIAEELCKSYHHSFNLQINIIRFFSLYGINLKKQLLFDACQKISSKQSTITFYGTGNETRDFLNIKDALDLIMLIMKKNNKFLIINGGSGKSTSVKQVIKLLLTYFNTEKKVVFNGIEKPGDPKHYMADISNIKKLNWLPRLTIEESLKEYVAWFKKNKL